MRDDGAIAIERGERAFAPGDRVMFLRNDRELGVKNGTLGTVAEVTKDSMRVILDGKEGRAVGFNLRDYGAVEYGYAATVHKSQGATVDRVFVLATPGMDRHLAYVGMTRHRDEAIAPCRAQRLQGLRRAQAAALPRAGEGHHARLRRAPRTRYRAHPGRGQGADRAAAGEGARGADAGGQTAGARSRRALQGGAAGVYRRGGQASTSIPRPRSRAGELREEMKGAALEIAKDPARMREAERAGIAPQVKSLVRQAEQSKERGLQKDRDFDLER